VALRRVSGVKHVEPRLSGELRELRQRLIVELQRGSNVSQRALARRLGVALGTVNRLLGDMVEAGYIEVCNRGVRPFAGVSFRPAHGVGLVILLVILIAMWAALAHAGELEDKLF